MMLLSQVPGGALSARQYGHGHHTATPGFLHKKPPLFSTNSKENTGFLSRRRPFPLTIAKAEGGGVEPTSATKQPFPTNSSGGPTPWPPSFSAGSSDTVFVGQEDVPLEGVIQFEKPNSSSRLDRWGRVALLAGGDVLALLLFSAIGRFSHGLSAFDYETLRTADPFIAGWFLGAYFLGGYGEDGRGMNGPSKAIIAAAKSWALGIPVSLTFA
uniref:Uncharacterized protein n=1 Tax=Rhizophora mucronata TaxID=61149 RepID=A0A2P2JS51_RHIMU